MHNKSTFALQLTFTRLYEMLCAIWPFVLFKKREKTLRGVLLLKSNAPPWVFSRFLNCANGTKSCKASHIENKCVVEII